MKKKTLIGLLHLNFLSGFAYAFYHFLLPPRSDVLVRRLWAYECWIIFGFYALFIFLLVRERHRDEKIIKLNFVKLKKLKSNI